MARVPLRTPEELPESYRYLLQDSAIGERHILQAMGNNPPLFQSSMRYANTVWSTCGLSDRRRELVILAVARSLDSRYEWHQHVPLARDAGVDAADIHAIADGEWDGFDGTDRLLIEYAAALAERSVTDDLQDRLTAKFDDDAMIGITMLASNYVSTAHWLDSLAVEPEETFVGWHPDSMNRD